MITCPCQSPIPDWHKMTPYTLISSTDQHTDGNTCQEEDALIIQGKLFLEESNKDQQNAESLGNEHQQEIIFAGLIVE
jgi:hypothetical protein